MENQTVTYHVLDQSIIIHIDGIRHMVAKGDIRYNSAKEFIRNKDLSGLQEFFEFSNDDGSLFIKVGSGIQLRGETIPHDISDKILRLQEEELPILPLLNFCKRLLANPDEHVRSALYAFLIDEKHPITEEGNFIAYKGVSDNYKDSRSGTFDNTPGKIVEMPRKDVDPDPKVTCSKGLHVAGYNYAQNWSSTLLEVEVDPRDVVAVPDDYNRTKMRTCRYRVLRHGGEQLKMEIYQEKEMEAVPIQYEPNQVESYIKKRKHLEITQKQIAEYIPDVFKDRRKVGAFETKDSEKRAKDTETIKAYINAVEILSGEKNEPVQEEDVQEYKSIKDMPLYRQVEFFTEHRKILGITQPEIGKILDVSRKVIGKIENDYKKREDKELKSYCKAVTTLIKQHIKFGTITQYNEKGIKLITTLRIKILKTSIEDIAKFIGCSTNTLTKFEDIKPITDRDEKNIFIPYVEIINKLLKKQKNTKRLTIFSYNEEL